jgi:hypothetical protein
MNLPSLLSRRMHWPKRKKHQRERESKKLGFDFVLYNFLPSVCLISPAMHYACAFSPCGQ